MSPIPADDHAHVRCPQCGALPNCAARPCATCNPSNRAELAEAAQAAAQEELQPYPGLNATFRHSADPANWGEERLLVLGSSPIVLLEPVFNEGTDVISHFNLDVTDLGPAEAADLLSSIADTLRAQVQAGTPLMPLGEQVPEDVEDRAVANGDITL